MNVSMIWCCDDTMTSSECSVRVRTRKAALGYCVLLFHPGTNMPRDMPIHLWFTVHFNTAVIGLMIVPWLRPQHSRDMLHTTLPSCTEASSSKLHALSHNYAFTTPLPFYQPGWRNLSSLLTHLHLLHYICTSTLEITESQGLTQGFSPRCQLN